MPKAKYMGLMPNKDFDMAHDSFVRACLNAVRSVTHTRNCLHAPVVKVRGWEYGVLIRSKDTGASCWVGFHRLVTYEDPVKALNYIIDGLQEESRSDIIEAH